MVRWQCRRAEADGNVPSRSFTKRFLPEVVDFSAAFVDQTKSLGFWTAHCISPKVYIRNIE